MKKLFVIQLIFLQVAWTISSKSQTTIYKAAVGDTLLIASSSITYPYPTCAQWVSVNAYYNDSSNFFLRYSIDQAVVYYWIYFIPKVSGNFHGRFHFSEFYASNRCNHQDSTNLEFYCETTHDSSQIIFKPYIYTSKLIVDTAKEIIYGQVQTTLHNYSGEELVVDSVRYIGSSPNLCFLSLDSAMSSKHIVIPFDSADDSLNIYIISKKGPGLTIDAGALIYEHIGNTEHLDTLLFTFSSDPFCCPQANFIGPFTTNGIKFVATSGETLDSAVTIVYSKFVTNFSIDSLKYPFSLTVEDKPLRKILHIHYHPLFHDTSDAGLNIFYSVRNFNGDNVSFGVRNTDYNFMFLGLYWVALTNDVRQNCTHDSALRISPNPAGKIITVSLTDNQESYGIAIFSSNGILVKTLSINSFPSQINLSDLSSGNYYLEVRGKQRSYYQKFIIE